MNKKVQAAKYLLSDLISAVISWTVFYAYRKIYIESDKYGIRIVPTWDTKFFISIAGITMFWIALYYFTGYYRDPYRKSRLKEFLQTFIICIIGVVIIFFTLLLDDTVKNYHSYYQSLQVLFIVQFTLTFIPRLILSTITNNKIHKRIIGFNTLLVGSNEKAYNLFNEMQAQIKSSGNKFIGYVCLESLSAESTQIESRLKRLGDISQIQQIIASRKIEEVIIAIETSEHKHIESLLNQIDDGSIKVKVIPDMYDILSGSVRMNSIFDSPLIEVSREIMPAWQQSFKRIIDVVLSAFVLVCFSWLYLVLMVLVKITSKGPAFYSHYRIGLHGKPFLIYKFRSMYIDAEKNGPALAFKTDPRITPIGKFLRKVRLDEMPQFYNVLKGDMSIVGPRPERQFFIDQILLKAPHYRHLHKVRPGITSWGQVKYGYAENVDQMVARLKYDIIYVENMSLILDIKILIYTVIIVFQGRGK